MAAAYPPLQVAWQVGSRLACRALGSGCIIEPRLSVKLMHSRSMKVLLLILSSVAAGVLARGALAGSANRASAAESPTHGRPTVVEGLDSLQIVGQFQSVIRNYAVFGDTDHDGANEILFSTANTLRVLEYAHYAQFVLAYDGPFVSPLATGDIDQDGKSDVVDLGANSQLRVFESVDASSHPSVLTWQSPPISNQVGFAAIADTDIDGRLEIVYLFWVGVIRIVIFECEGDDTYVQKYLSPLDARALPDESPSLQGIHVPWAGDELVWDLDQDGRPEIADGGQGRLRIFESTADDVWEEIYSDSTGLVGSRILTGGQDTDGDGARELFLGGEDWTVEPVLRKVFVYQPTGERSYTRVAELSGFDNGTGGQWGTLARLEPDGKFRFVWGLVGHLRIYDAPCPGVWSLESIVLDPVPARLAVFAYDLNRNGRDEIYWLSNNRFVNSLVLERPTVPTSLLEPSSTPLMNALRISPSPSRANASVFLHPAAAVPAAEWSVFDASGRLVLRQDLGAPARSWILPVAAWRPGVYFLRASDANGRPIASGRTTVIR